MKIVIDDLMTEKESKLMHDTDLQFLQEFLDYSITLSKHKIEIISKILNRSKREKFPDKHQKNTKVFLKLFLMKTMKSFLTQLKVVL